MAMSRRGPRGGPTPRAGAGASTDGARVVTAAPSSQAAAERQERMRQAMAPSRPGRVRLLGERLNARFFREAWAELKKVHWPSRVQARNLTAMVVGVAFGVGMILGGMDFVFARVFEFILRIG